MFVRFVISRKDPDSEVSQGVFAAASDLRHSGQLAPHEQDELDGAIDWFADHLKTPSRFNRSASKGHYRRTTKGISWFKPTATDHVAQIRRMAAVMNEHGWLVSMIKTRNPGYIVYEDDYQVVAEPFNDTPT